MIQAADLEKDCNSFIVCVAIGMFVLGVWGITFPSFFPEQVYYGPVPSERITFLTGPALQNRGPS